MLRGNWNGQPLGSGTDLWKYWTERCAGNLSDEEWNAIEGGIARSPGFCMTMGTAATMTALSGSAGHDAARRVVDPRAGFQPRRHGDGQRPAASSRWSGKIASPRDILTRAAFRERHRRRHGDRRLDQCHHSPGGAGADAAASICRCAVFDEISQRVPVLANIRPSGEFLMEDFYYAGGLRALMAEITRSAAPRLPHRQRQDAGRESSKARAVVNREVIRAREHPLARDRRHGDSVRQPGAGWRGDQDRRRPIPRCWQHTGPAVVFRDYRRHGSAHRSRRSGRGREIPCWCCSNAGPLGGPGMPEWGMLPIPKKLLQRGVRDMVRISDARMSGTSYGTCVLHVSPESYVGGPLALVRDGDEISLDVPARRLDLMVDDAELERRRAAWKPPVARYARGYLSLYSERVTQANKGCDFDFLSRQGELPERDVR